MLSLSDNNLADVIKHLTSTQDIFMACLILIIFISNKWKDPLNFSKIRQIPLILNHPF